MKSKNTKKSNNMKNKNLLKQKTKRSKTKSKIKEKEKKAQQSSITKDLIINLKSTNKKYKLVKSLINGLDFLPFILFQSINEVFYIIYLKEGKEYYNSNLNKEKKIISCYDVINEQTVFEIKNAHSDDIIGIKYIFDKKNKRDLILSISYTKIKIWNFQNMEVLYEINTKYNNINNIYNINFFINIINNDEYIHIIEASNDSNIITYNIDGQIIKTINNTKNILNIESFTGDKTKNSYIIINHNDYLVSYDYNKNKKYMNYFHNTYNERFTIIINKEDEKFKLIGLGCDYPFIIIWDFHSGDKIYDIFLKENIVSEFNLEIDNSFLWDKNHLCLCFIKREKFLIGCYLKLFDLKKCNICGDLMDMDKRNIYKIKRFQHPLFGDCLITQYSRVKIEIWKLKDSIDDFNISKIIKK